VLTSCAGSLGAGPRVPLAPGQASAARAFESTARVAGSATRADTILYRFHGSTDGGSPFSGLVAVGSVLYGTTFEGGASGPGTVYKITTDGDESVFHSFVVDPHGWPISGLAESNGTLYGTATGAEPFGPQYGGTVFAVETSRVKRYAILHIFGHGSDGSYPSARVMSVGGTLYGTTEQGGAKDMGTVFSLTKSGTERVLHSFGRGSDGSYPESGLIEVNGTLYGTTSEGGAANAGTVYAIDTAGNEKIIYSFKGGTDGAEPCGSQPCGGLVHIGSTLYGTTALGGDADDGTVFRVTTSGKESVLYDFAGGTDGKSPNDLSLYRGKLYGTTSEGGGTGCAPYAGCGTAFEIGPSGTETVLYRFTGGADGALPNGALAGLDDKLYGTTGAGGMGSCFLPVAGCGTVFSIPT
jgi:uncharacterized repeat protein (TIGR03803 family)